MINYVLYFILLNKLIFLFYQILHTVTYTYNFHLNSYHDTHHDLKKKSNIISLIAMLLFVTNIKTLYI